MNITLNTAMFAASTVICDGCEIDGFSEIAPNEYKLECGEEVIAHIDATQFIEIDSDGIAQATDIEGQARQFEFRVSRPLTASDI